MLVCYNDYSITKHIVDNLFKIETKTQQKRVSFTSTWKVYDKGFFRLYIL